MYEEYVKRCPFCGCNAKVVETGLISVVKCTNCGAEGMRVSGPKSKDARTERAIAAWDMRAPESVIGYGPRQSDAELVNEIIRVTHNVRNTPDLDLIRCVFERTACLDYKSRSYIRELVDRFRRKDSIISEIHTACALGPNPQETPEHDTDEEEEVYAQGEST